ncbi:neuraminidase [Tamlana nanhaiensis]|uniref:Neuraminidase n=1 Tax=Neotamlana nanhaiensis TaxID=1382798 RepID=A0A0D7W6T7_9FLAO|nr:neuraminidase [Tamlana nanhaiensis]
MAFLVCLIIFSACSQKITQTTVGLGWGNNSVNTVKFRKNAITSFNGYQFTAYYNPDKFLVLAKRKQNSKNWEIHQTQYKGNTNDAHNSISIVIDGDGFLHVSWDHHNTRLRYAKSVQPMALNLGDEMPMTGLQEDKVTYPEFHSLPKGNLLFLYRSGESGRGNMVVNSYNLKSEKWTQLHSNLIDGENKRSAYWQACVDNKGTLHVSWVWRETWGVETNHDIAYARSNDGGLTWENSKGHSYELPIKLNSAEYACKIPQNSNLINQTSMTVDGVGNPYIVNYWNDAAKIPQYQIVYLENNIWRTLNTGFRTQSFSLGGGGTKRIPISRPSILVEDLKDDKLITVIFRDEERQNKVSLAQSLLNKPSWKITDLTKTSLGQWEPNYDAALWQSKKILNIFVQNVTQIDGEGLAENQSSPVEILSVSKINQLITK